MVGGMRAHFDANAIGPYNFRSGDLMTVSIESFEIVHSSGMLYHIPSPIGYIQKLRSITSKFCVLTSTIMHTHVKSEEGESTFPEGCTLFVPGLERFLC